MPRPYQYPLSESERQELEQERDHNPKPYVRQRAAGILKVAAGQSIRHVALHGLLKEWDPETVSGWLERYRTQGVAGLVVQAGRGRKSAFSPSRGRRGAGGSR